MDPRVQAMSLFDPKIFIVILMWAVYSFALYARRSIGWSGRRTAVLSAVGFTVMLLNFVPIGYFVTAEPQLLLTTRRPRPPTVMNLFLLGASHHSTPIALRERLDFTRRGVTAALAELARLPGLSEIVVLSTCNRSEIYAVCDAPRRMRRTLATFMSAFHDVPESAIAPHLFARTDADVARHLFRVAAGLDSLVVGEPQILGQVKDAFTIASEQHCTGVFFNRLFHWSFGAGKRVRSETGLGEGAVSVSYASIALARKIFGKLGNLRALLVGAGEMAELTATHLRAQQVQAIGVANRTASQAAALAARIAGEAVPWERIADALTSYDIVVTATGSAAPIVTRADVAIAMKPRRDRPLFVIDLGVPRDRRSGRGRDRAGVPVQHRRPARDRPGESGAAPVAGRSGRAADRRRGGQVHGLAALAGGHPDRRCPPRAVRSRAPVGAGAPRAETRRAVAGRPGARRRG